MEPTTHDLEPTTHDLGPTTHDLGPTTHDPRPIDTPRSGKSFRRYDLPGEVNIIIEKKKKNLLLRPTVSEGRVELFPNPENCYHVHVNL